MATGKKILYGALAGIIAAGIFGAMMLQMMPDTLPKIAQLYSFSATSAGFIIHLIHGALIGGLFGALTSVETSTLATSFYGVLYGVIWWIIGPILVMPTWLGAGPRLSIEGIQAALPSLPGHIVFGLVLGILFALFTGTKQAESKVANKERGEAATHKQPNNTSPDKDRETDSDGRDSSNTL